MKNENSVSLKGKGLAINKGGKAIVCLAAEPHEYKVF